MREARDRFGVGWFPSAIWMLIAAAPLTVVRPSGPVRPFRAGTAAEQLGGELQHLAAAAQVDQVDLVQEA